MEMTTIADLIATLGLPIVLVLAMGWFIFQLWKQSVAREEKLMSELTATRLVNEKALDTIAEYAEKLGVIESDVAEIKAAITNH
jgi:hypothetical protein